MGKLGRGALALAVSAFLMVGGAACGGGEDDEGGSSGEGKSGGSAVFAQTSQPDNIDPALAYTTNAWEPEWLIYTPPLTYKHAEGAEGAELIPGLAEKMPEISSDGKTYKFTFRDGLKYSDGTALKASDFEATIKRLLAMGSDGSPFYLGIVGAEEFQTSGKKKGDIEGIVTDDQTREVTVKLKTPDATFQNILAMNFSGLVPGNTPVKELTEDPPPGIGPYMFTKSVPNREFVIEKNPNFPDIPEIPKGNLDKITTKIVKSPQRQTQDVIRGQLDYHQDPPPSDLIGTVRAKYKDRYKEYTAVNTRYFFMNVDEKPFNKKAVRQAVNYAIDKRAIARIYGGTLTPTCNFLPPGMPGHEKRDPCPYGDPNEAPDIEKARQLIEQAGEKGTEVTAWGNNDDPTPRVTEYYAEVLNKIGLKAKPKILDGGVYFQTVGNEKTHAQTGYYGWFQDFPHPFNFFFLQDGDSIQPQNNNNLSRVNDPQINEGIDKLRQETDLDSVVGEWAKLDQRLIDEAYIAPYGHSKNALFLSERMDFENCALVHPLYLNDYSSFCLK